MKLDVPDTLANAVTGVGPTTTTKALYNHIGDGPFGNSDVDLYRISATLGSTRRRRRPCRRAGRRWTRSCGCSTPPGPLAYNDDYSGLYSQITYSFPATGTYYIGVSGYPNGAYSPEVGGSGVAGSTGDYQLRLALTAAADVGDTLSTRSP